MTILVFGVIDWNYLRQRPQQLARELARGHDVIYAHPRTFLGSWSQRASLPPGALAAWRHDPDREGLRLDVFSPLGPPRHRGGWLRSLGDRLFLDGLRARLRRDRRVPDVVWVGHPSHERWLEPFADIPLLYDCMDDWAGFPGATDEAAREARLVARARWVIASSRPLAERMERAGADVRLVPNGVEHGHFRAAVERFASARGEERAGRPPVAVTVGTFGSWIDYPLIAEIARRSPDWRFRMIGPIEAPPPGGVPRASNLEWVGRRPYADLPEEFARADAAFLPFRLEGLAASVDPVKAYEFLAAGLAVAAVPLPELAKFERGIAIAGDAERFRAALDAAREMSRTVDGRRTLSDSVALHSWGARAAAISEFLRPGRNAP